MTIAPTPAQAKQSLFHLAADAQYIDGEIGIAAELLESDDPKNRQIAADLIEELLLAQGHAKDRVLAKADNVCAYLQNLRAQADYRANEAKRLKALADADAAKVKALEGYLIGALQTALPGQTKYSLPTFEVRSRATESVELLDADAVPTELRKTPPAQADMAPDKTAIKAVLKAGKTVPGAVLKQSRSWSIK